MIGIEEMLSQLENKIFTKVRSNPMKYYNEQTGGLKNEQMLISHAVDELLHQHAKMTDEEDLWLLGEVISNVRGIFTFDSIRKNVENVVNETRKRNFESC